MLHFFKFMRWNWTICGAKGKISEQSEENDARTQQSCHTAEVEFVGNAVVKWWPFPFFLLRMWCYPKRKKNKVEVLLFIAYFGFTGPAHLRSNLAACGPRIKMSMMYIQTVSISLTNSMCKRYRSLKKMMSLWLADPPCSISPSWGIGPWVLYYRDSVI